MLMNLENIVSGKTQTKKATYYIIQLHKIHKVSKPIESEGTIMVVRGWYGPGKGVRHGEWLLMCTGGDENVLKLTRVAVVQLYGYTKKHWIEHFQNWILWYVDDILF